MDELNRTPLVSVVIPCFNQAHFLDEAIASVLEQTYFPLEVTVIDDGSSDNSFEVAGRHPTVRRIRQPNRGVASARNKGLAATSGEFLLFLDADDKLRSGAVEIGIEAILKRPKVGLVAGMCVDIGIDGQSMGERRQPLVTQDYYPRLLRECYIWSGSSVLYRRSAIEAVGGFNEALTAGDDYELYLKLARRFPVFCHDAVVTEYRRHGANTTRSSALVLTSQLQVLRGQRSDLRDRREREAQRDGIRNTRAEHGGAVAERIAEDWRARRWRQVLAGLRTLARHDPRGLVRLAFGSPRRPPAAPVSQGGAPS